MEKIYSDERKEVYMVSSEDFMDDLVDNTVQEIINEDNTFNMKINTELKKQFNIKCIENGTTMSKVLKDFIKEYVK